MEDNNGKGVTILLPGEQPAMARAQGVPRIIQRPENKRVPVTFSAFLLMGL